MDRKAPNYLLVIIIMLTAVIVSYWVRSKPVNVTYSANFESVPKTIAGWHGQDMDISSEIQNSIEADQLMSRMYMNDDRYSYMGLLVVYRKYGRRGFVHRPEMCYPAAGWEILSKGYTTMPYDGKIVPAVKIIAEKDSEKEVVVYWFASGERMEANFAKQQLWMALDRLRPQKYGWAFIRLNAPIVESEKDTLATMRAFVKMASKPLVKSLADQ